ncbi:hypothetical protein PTE30175_01625 [Pandoraea terrae]|uniref:Uncharacterized protein n=2 Tax=Pandoraea terrae TaxID=1537710 RepID=A0A5E4TWN8_9BURK|nr:hypothetical protein PTE30175_01625 [Pandoraea terrae]
MKQSRTMISVVPVPEAWHLEGRLEELFTRAAETSPHPMQSFDYDTYHRMNDARGAHEVARGVYVGAIAIALSGDSVPTLREVFTQSII